MQVRIGFHIQQAYWFYIDYYRGELYVAFLLPLLCLPTKLCKTETKILVLLNAAAAAAAAALLLSATRYPHLEPVSETQLARELFARVFGAATSEMVNACRKWKKYSRSINTYGIICLNDKLNQYESID